MRVASNLFYDASDLQNKKMVGDDNLQNNVLEKNDQFVYKIHPDVLSKALGI